MAMNTHDL